MDGTTGNVIFAAMLKINQTYHWQALIIYNWRGYDLLSFIANLKVKPLRFDFQNMRLLFDIRETCELFLKSNWLKLF